MNEREDQQESATANGHCDVEPETDGGLLATYELRADGTNSTLRYVFACKDTCDAGRDEEQSGNKRREKTYIYAHASNDEVERRGASPTPSEGTLSQSSTPSFAHRRRAPRSLEPIVRRLQALGEGPRSCIRPIVAELHSGVNT
jgi:hypothetical protein